MKILHKHILHMHICMPQACTCTLPTYMHIHTCDHMATSTHSPTYVHTQSTNIYMLHGHTYLHLYAHINIHTCRYINTIYIAHVHAHMKNTYTQVCTTLPYSTHIYMTCGHTPTSLHRHTYVHAYTPCAHADVQATRPPTHGPENTSVLPLTSMYISSEREADCTLRPLSALSTVRSCPPLGFPTNLQFLSN